MTPEHMVGKLYNSNNKMGETDKGDRFKNTGSPCSG